MNDTQAVSWWRGRRGEWYVVAQVALLALVFIGPRSPTGWSAWPAGLAAPARLIGIVAIALGSVLLLTGGFKLGRPDLTPLPYPREGGMLRQSGPYAIVRHPMYAGAVAIAFGWALLVQGTLTLVYALAMLGFADIKATREEQWLLGRYPEYAEYRRRVRKLIPFVY